MDLPDLERRSLLEKLQAVTQVSTEALINKDPVESGPANYDELYKSMNWLAKLVLWIKCLIFSTSRHHLLRGSMVKKLVRKLEIQAKGLLDAPRGMLQDGFMLELQQLRNAAKYFYNLLDRTLEKERIAFFAFLASLDLELVHSQLMLETDPWLAAQGRPEAMEAEIRQIVNKAIDNAFLLIGEEQRRAMYQNVHGLFVLKSLSAFQFERLMKPFTAGYSDRHEVSLSAVSDQLRELGAILGALELPPSRQLMEAFFSFFFADQMEDRNFDLEAAVRAELTNTEKALSAIRGFNNRVPLHNIIRLALNDPDFQSDPVAGGEDWFALFRIFWRERTEKRYQKWLAEKRIHELQLRIDSLVGSNWAGSFAHLVAADAAADETAVPVRYARALRCLDSFYNVVFVQQLNRPLKLILLEGEFYKRDNRLDFTDAYSKILELPDLLRKYDEKLSSVGEYGQAFLQSRQELSSLSAKRRKLESAIQAAETEAETIIRGTTEAMARLQQVLKGILSGNSRERYDSLANLSRMDGKANADFLRQLEAAKDRLEQVVGLVNELSRLAMMNETMLDVAVVMNEVAGAESVRVVASDTGNRPS